MTINTDTILFDSLDELKERMNYYEKFVYDCANQEIAHIDLIPGYINKDINNPYGVLIEYNVEGDKPIAIFLMMKEENLVNVFKDLKEHWPYWYAMIFGEIYYCSLI